MNLNKMFSKMGIDSETVETMQKDYMERLLSAVRTLEDLGYTYSKESGWTKL